MIIDRSNFKVVATDVARFFVAKLGQDPEGDRLAKIGIWIYICTELQIFCSPITAIIPSSDVYTAVCELDGLGGGNPFSSKRDFGKLANVQWSY